ncbi:MAG: hypothetical protein IPM32_02540 [Ignavibacteriae bacterium]|nr:hypothetical protein [Ignavibacteriota bacterium]
MGQQQLLLILLGILVIGVAIFVGVELFTSNAIEQKRNEIINECTILASEAQLYYRKPKVYGGGGKSFVGWKIPREYNKTEAGFFVQASVQPEEVIITGTGNELVTATDSVQIQMVVTRDAFQTIIIH